MTFQKGHKLSVGNKGGGRKSFKDEQLKIRVIEKAWTKKDKRMTDQDATQIVLKDMGEKIKGDPNNPIIVKQITGMKVQKDGNSI
jgi:hypothetical protein